jgi:hypothetical protein
VLSLSSVSCCVPSHFTGTLKVRKGCVHVIRVFTYGTGWNTGTCLYMIWTGLGCLLQCVNSIVWNKNTINRAPVYCDICKSLRALTLRDSESSVHSLSDVSVTPQQRVFKSHSMLQSRLLHFALTAASTRPLRQKLRCPRMPTGAGPSYMICSLVSAFRFSR